MGSDTTDSFDPTIYEFDARPADETAVTIKARTAVIRTTDRITFRRCRRRWGWSSHLRGNLGSKDGQSPLWVGSGFHFALEDCHGARRFPSARAAFAEYVAATRRFDERGLPANWQEDWELADKMLGYYEDEWLRYRQPLKTYVHNGVPQVEVNFRVDMTSQFTPEQLAYWGYDKVMYSGTLDRVIEDDFGLLWIVEYKTAKAIQTLHLANDSQVSSYCWAGPYIYGRPIAGVVYQQHRKDFPKEPAVLGNGQLSTRADQLITFASLRRSLINLYGSIDATPAKYVSMLNTYSREETPDRDKFVYRSWVPRNEHQAQAEGVKILLETEEMLNPHLALYPNPDRSCQFMCPFNGSCVSLDDGSDWETELDLMFKQRDAVYDNWRKLIRWPDEDKHHDFQNQVEGTI